MALPSEQQAEIQLQLQRAVIACNERCLYFSAKWAAELLNSFPSAEDEFDHDNSDTDIDEDGDEQAVPLFTNHDRKEATLESRELSKYLMAKSFFDCREFDRCAAVFLTNNVPHSAPTRTNALSPSIIQSPKTKTKTKSKSAAPQSKPVRPFAATPKNISQKSLFLALYARYLSGEKRKNEESETILGPSDGPATSNKEIAGVVLVLEDYFNSRGGMQNIANSQGWLDYLYGLCLVRSKSQDLARQWLLRAINLNPYNWAAWQELASLIESTEELAQIATHIPRNIMAFFFHVHCNSELFIQTPEVFKSLADMQAMFPRSAFLQQQAALLHYHARDHENAEMLFATLQRDHPFRLEGMETYSNLLYVLPNRPKLASLAARASDTDKFRPETNCILGNYYSLISEHEKAILHFRRALTLDRSFASAWTLMGHEYIELKNTQAAIESYRRAVDNNRKDYRAWYGLGQGYEVLECWSYSLHYFQRAAALCPGDPKLWAAVGNAYAKCGKLSNAIQAYKRALAVGAQMDTSSSFGSSATNDPLAHAVGGALDPHILHDIALLYERDGNNDEAAAYMELCLAQEEGETEGEEGLGVTQITSRARLWLARWCYGAGEWQRAMELANELCQDGVEVEEAKALVRDLRGRIARAEEQ